MSRQTRLAVLVASVVALLSSAGCGGGGGRDLPFALETYAPLVTQLRQAIDTRDAALLPQVVRSRYGDTELWIGGWGGCGAGVRTVPMTPENVDAILQGAQIELVAIGAADACEGNNVAYGVLTKGWKGKVLPYTYSGEGGPSTGILDYTFTEDTALLVFQSAAFDMSQPAFFGLAPEGPFEEVAALP